MMTNCEGFDGNPVSEEAFLAMERKADQRHEYINGHILAMPDESRNHNTIALNLTTLLNVHQRGKPCRPYINGIKVRAAGDIYYPDVVVDCSNAVQGGYFADHPILIVEVLSTSTRKKDLTTKLVQYRNIPSMQEYVLVEQDIVRVQVLRKENQWQYEESTVGDVVDLRSVGLILPVMTIYSGVENPEIKECRASIQ